MLLESGLVFRSLHSLLRENFCKHSFNWSHWGQQENRFCSLAVLAVASRNTLCRCPRRKLKREKNNIAQTLCTAKPCQHLSGLHPRHLLKHTALQVPGHPCCPRQSSQTKSLPGCARSHLVQIRQKQEPRAGGRFAEIRAILVQTSYVLLIGRINEPGCSSVAIRNNTTAILVPFRCWEVGLLINTFPLLISV